MFNPHHAEIDSGFLTLPAASDRTLPKLHRKLRLLVLRELLQPMHPSMPAGLRTTVGRLQPQLASCAKLAPERVLDAVGSPDVMVPMLCMRGGLIAPETALAAALPNLLLALRGSAAGSESLLWDLPVERLTDVTDNRCLSFEPNADGLLINASGAEVRLCSDELVDPLDASGDLATHPSCQLTRPFHEVPGVGDRVFSLLDSNPLALVEHHPDKQGNRLDLGDRTPAEWTQKLGAAVRIIRMALPQLADELCTSLTRIVPVGFEPQVHLSASYREAPGLIYLTLHPSDLTMAEAIIHETQHGKLNALSWFDAVLHNGQSEWTNSPVRPDLRPLMGVLLAVHAFVPVAALHMSLKQQGWPPSLGPDFERHRLQVLRSNAAGLESLRSKAKATPLGKRLLDDLQHLHDTTLAGEHLGDLTAEDAKQMSPRHL